MTQVLFGLALISASLQTGWALFSEGQLQALPVVALALCYGWARALAGARGGAEKSLLRIRGGERDTFNLK